jgi:hypothetical protein
MAGKDPAMRKASALTRDALRRMVATGKAHPVTWLNYYWATAEVWVWGKLADAESYLQTVQHAFARSEAKIKAEGGHVTGGGTQFLRIDNVAIVIPEPANAEPHALTAALAELAKTK